MISFGPAKRFKFGKYLVFHDEYVNHAYPYSHSFSISEYRKQHVAMLLSVQVYSNFSKPEDQIAIQVRGDKGFFLKTFFTF